MVNAANEVMRIVRTITARFAAGPEQSGSAFMVGPGDLVTCAHVVVSDSGQTASAVRVTHPSGRTHTGTVEAVNQTYDLARISCGEQERSPAFEIALPVIGEAVVFAGIPQGIAQPSVFPGMISLTGTGLIASPRCELIQIAGMINNLDIKFEVQQ